MSKPSHRAATQLNKLARHQYPKAKATAEDSISLIGTVGPEGPSLITTSDKADSMLGMLQLTAQQQPEVAAFALECDVAGPGITKGKIYTCVVAIEDDTIGFRTTDDRGFPCFYSSMHFIEPAAKSSRERLRFVAPSGEIDAEKLRICDQLYTDIEGSSRGRAWLATNEEADEDIARIHAGFRPTTVFDGPNDSPTGPNLFAAAVALTLLAVTLGVILAIGYGLVELWQAAAHLFTHLHTNAGDRTHV